MNDLLTDTTMNMIRGIAVIIMLFLILPDSARATDGLTLHACIDKALASHPAIRSARATLNADKGRATQATSPYLPQVQASTGYTESHTGGGAFGDTISKSYTTSLTVNQTLYDFGRTGNSRDAALLGTRSGEMDIERVMQEVVLNVKQAYYALLQAKKLTTVAEQTLAQTEDHLKQAEAFFHAGSKPRFDVTRSEVDVNNARLGLINAGNTVRLNTIALYNAMGVEPSGPLEIEDILAQPTVVPSFEKARADALKGRPDLLKAEADILAAQARVRSEQSNYMPTLSANGTYNWAHGTTQMGQFNGVELGGSINDSWNAGIILTLPLFQGGLTSGRVSEARANQHMLEAQRDTLKQSILLDINQVYADLESATARINVMESSLKKSRESLELAQGRYQAGVGPSIEVTDARVAESKAETDHVQALYDYQLAASRLYKAMGQGMER